MLELRQEWNNGMTYQNLIEDLDTRDASEEEIEEIREFYDGNKVGRRFPNWSEGDYGNWNLQDFQNTKNIQDILLWGNAALQMHYLRNLEITNWSTENDHFAATLETLVNDLHDGNPDDEDIIKTSYVNQGGHGTVIAYADTENPEIEGENKWHWVDTTSEAIFSTQRLDKLPHGGYNPFIQGYQGNQQVSEGELVKLSGEIQDAGEKITAPVQSTRCTVAVWKVATLRRYDGFNVNSYWSIEGVGIDAGTLVIAGEGHETTVSDVSREIPLSATDEVRHLLGSTENSVLDSVAEELDSPDFEDRRPPGEEWAERYHDLGNRIDFDAKPADSPGILGRILNAIRTPEGTVQFQETTMSAGETVTVVGSAGQNGDVRLRGSGEVDPVITRSSLSAFEGTRRRAALIQLYGIPLFVTALCSLAGVGVFLNP